MSPRLPGWLLFGSLGLNIFLVGAWLGDRMADRPPARPSGAQPDFPPSKDRGNLHRPPPPSGKGHHRPRRGGPPSRELHSTLIEVMGGRDDPRVQQVVTWEHRRSPERRKRREESRTRIEEALFKEPFDENAFRKALDEAGQQGETMRARAQEQLVGLAKQLTTEERQELKRRLSERNKEFSPRKSSP